MISNYDPSLVTNISDDDHITTFKGSKIDLFSDISLDSPPLGLSLKKSDSFIDLIQRTVYGDGIIHTEAKTSKDANTNNQKKRKNKSEKDKEKKKASNFPANSIKIGTWEKMAVNEGEVVVKFYFAKRKLVWEILERTLKRKIEVQWEEISAIRASFPERRCSILQVELNRPPSFFEEKDPQPKRHTLWQPALDFTGGQGSVYRVHQLEFAEGPLKRHYEKLLALDKQMKIVSQCPFSTISHFSVTYQRNLYDRLAQTTQPLKKRHRSSFSLANSSNTALLFQTSTTITQNNTSELPTQTDIGNPCSSGTQQVFKTKVRKSSPRAACLSQTNTRNQSSKRTPTSKNADLSKRKGKDSTSTSGHISKTNTRNINSSSTELSRTDIRHPSSASTIQFQTNMRLSSSTAVQVSQTNIGNLSPTNKFLSQTNTIPSSITTLLSQKKARIASCTSILSSQTDIRNPSSTSRDLSETNTQDLSHKFDFLSHTDIRPTCSTTAYLSHTNFRNPSPTSALLSQTNAHNSKSAFPSHMHTRNPNPTSELLPQTNFRNPSSTSTLLSQINMHNSASAFPSHVYTRNPNPTSELLPQKFFRNPSSTNTLLSQINVHNSTNAFPSHVHTENSNPTSEALPQTNFRIPSSTSTLLYQINVHNSMSAFPSHVHTINPNPTSELLPQTNFRNPGSTSALLSQINVHNSTSAFPSHVHTRNQNHTNVPQTNIRSMDTHRFYSPYYIQENIFTPIDNLGNLYTPHHIPNDQQLDLLYVNNNEYHQNLGISIPFADIHDNISPYRVDNFYNQVSPIMLPNIIERTSQEPDIHLSNPNNQVMPDNDFEQEEDGDVICKMFLNDTEEEQTEPCNIPSSWDLDNIEDHLFNDQFASISPDHEALVRKIRSINAHLNRLGD